MTKWTLPVMHGNMELTEEQKLQVAEFQAMERTLGLSRLLSLNGTTHGGKRDLYEIFGYNRAPAPGDFSFRFQRGDIATRIVEAFPNAVWSNPPEIVDDESIQEQTEFEKAVEDLFAELNVWHYLHRADILANLGRFSILLIGFSGSGDPKNAVSNSAKAVYMMPYGEENAKVHTFEKNTSNPRFGKPLTYQLTIPDVSSGVYQSPQRPGAPNGGRTIEVHFSRTLHFAQGLLDNEVYGRPILEKVYNKLDDLDKIVGGGAEMYWLNSRGGLSLNAEKDAKVADPTALTQHAEDYVNQLSRILKTQGMTVTPLQFRIEPNKDQFEAVISLISGATEIPRRILLGSEEGKLASSQDEDNWLSRVKERRTRFSEPVMLRPLIKMFIEHGMLPKPKDDKYKVKWPDLLSASEKDQADIAVKKAQAISAYVNAPGADLILTPRQFTEEVLKHPYLEAEIAELEKEHEQEEADALALEQENADAAHQRDLETVAVKSATTGGIGGGGKGQGTPKSTRIAEPGNAPVKSPAKAPR
jgi:hypothetical protein